MDPEPWKRDTHGNIQPWPVPEMVIVGARFRHGRYQAHLSQRKVAAMAGISQSAVSRLERGVSTGMSVERLIRVATVLGTGFPFGFCPHDHRCAWPFNPGARKTLAELFER